MPYDTCRYRVVNRRRESLDISTLSLIHADGTSPDFSIGQVIDAYFPETDIPYGKPYSISNAPGERMLAITVRSIGVFSRRLYTMQPGDSFEASTPYGSFKPKEKESDLVLIAAGMGIAPFRGMLAHFRLHSPARSITLLHSVRIVRDVIFEHDFELATKVMPNFIHQQFLTGDTSASTNSFTKRRITAHDINTHITGGANTEFLICGSFSFLETMQNGLRASGIPRNAITTSCISSLNGVLQP